MIGQISIAISLPGFTDLGRALAPLFLLMDLFLTRVYIRLAKREEKLSTRSLIFFFG